MFFLQSKSVKTGNMNGTVFMAEATQPDPWTPFPDADSLGMMQVLFLIGMYGYVLFVASNMISDGSELLLLVPSLADLVGSVVLPILGAVPDGVMVLFSGMGGNAQEEVSVGVGALAGSTVMLLTLPWFLSVMAGRVNIKDGKTQYKRPAGAGSDWEKLSPPNHFGLFDTGVSFSGELVQNTKFMVVTLIGYVIIQGPAFHYDVQARSSQNDADWKQETKLEASEENWWALAGLIFCVLAFRYYLHMQSSETKGSDGLIGDKIAQTNVEAMKTGKLTLRGVMAGLRERSWAAIDHKEDLNKVLVDKTAMEEVRRMCKLVAPFFAKYDSNGDNKMDFEEFRMFFNDVHETVDKDKQRQLFDSADTDASGFISFEEFVACVMSFAVDPMVVVGTESKKQHTMANPDKYLRPKDVEVDVEAAGGAEKGEEEEEGEEEEDMPEDLADLDPAEQQSRIKKRAFFKMALGTALVVVFSDPMVDLLNKLGKLTDIPSFYISFILAPLASNASELVAASNLAAKKTVKSMTASLSTLIGAGIMNNTFVLGIFLALIFFKKLAWKFSAETISIAVIEIVVALLVMRKSTMDLAESFVVLMCYPACLAIVYLLENVAHLD